MHPTIIHIDKKQFLTNLQAIRKQIGDKVKLMLPVKANAYGHGLVGISQLAEPLVDYLAVACLDEAEILRKNEIIKPILVLGAIDEDQIPGLLKNDLEITISSIYKAKLVAKYCLKLNAKCKVHVKVDTGMNRIGVKPESLPKLIDFVLNNANLDLVGLYSHFACSDELDNSFTDHQLAEFKELSKYVKSLKPDVICHIANSGGVCYFPDSYMDMVRPGILSYGYFPAKNIASVPLDLIKPCFSLKSKVTYFKVVPKNSGISYNHRYITHEETRIITLPIGYGDGYRRGLSNGASVVLREKKYPIAGTICMDMCMVDIGKHGEAYVGDEVILIGQQGEESVTISELALKLDTIIYEILVGFNERIPRVFV